MNMHPYPSSGRWSASSASDVPSLPSAGLFACRGGLKRGSLVEVSGPRSSGRFALALASLAAATAAGEPAALVDLGDHLDPRQAREAGVDLRRLLWARPTRLQHALAAAEMAVQAGFALVAADLGEGPLSWRGVGSGSFLRLARIAELHRAVVLVSSPYPVCGVAASVQAALERRGVLWEGEGGAPLLLGGIAAAAALRWRKEPLPPVPLSLPFHEP
jgi:hypothetical protein